MRPHCLRQLLGNAKIAGMETDLNLVGLRYNIAAAVFFVRIYLHFIRMSDVCPSMTNTCLGSVLSWTSPIVSKSNIHPTCKSNNIHRNIILKLVRPSRWRTVITFSMLLRMLIQNA